MSMHGVVNLRVNLKNLIIVMEILTMNVANYF